MPSIKREQGWINITPSLFFTLMVRMKVFLSLTATTFTKTSWYFNKRQPNFRFTWFSHMYWKQTNNCIATSYIFFQKGAYFAITILSIIALLKIIIKWDQSMESIFGSQELSGHHTQYFVIRPANEMNFMLCLMVENFPITREMSSACVFTLMQVLPKSPSQNF